jgi:hypothetical protein
MLYSILNGETDSVIFLLEQEELQAVVDYQDSAVASTIEITPKQKAEGVYYFYLWIGFIILLQAEKSFPGNAS